MHYKRVSKEDLRLIGYGTVEIGTQVTNTPSW